jgi:hypothetical protein
MSVPEFIKDFLTHNNKKRSSLFSVDKREDREKIWNSEYRASGEAGIDYRR